MSGLYISEQLRKVRNEIRRSNEEVIKESEQLYTILKSDLRKALETPGKDYITYTVDRKIGKTYNLMRLAAEYDYPLIVHDSSWARFIKSEANKAFGKDICVLSYRSVGITTDGMRIDVVLKDEMVPAEILRQKLSDYGLNWVSIVGIN